MPTSNPIRDIERAAGAAWDFAVEVYGEPGVESACAVLQDSFGLDVTLLLFGAWIGLDRGLALTADQAAAVGKGGEAWRAEVVRPLRAVRLRLSRSAPIPGPVTEALRVTIKQAELDSERIELAWLQQQAAGWTASDVAHPVAAVEHNLRTIFVQATGCAPDDHAARHLAVIGGAVNRRIPERARPCAV